MILKPCRECGQMFPDESMFGLESLCDACAMKPENQRSWRSDGAYDGAGKRVGP